MRILKASLVYFALVFGCGFVLGTIRTLWVAPRIGTRPAELLETPLMVVVSIVAARWTVLRLNIPSGRSPRLVMGAIALALLVAAEFGLVSLVRGLSIREYLATRDPMSGAAYYIALGLFAMMPVFVAHKSCPSPDQSNVPMK
jgi:hypothetical protein